METETYSTEDASVTTDVSELLSQIRHLQGKNAELEEEQAKITSKLQALEIDNGAMHKQLNELVFELRKATRNTSYENGKTDEIQPEMQNLQDTIEHLNLEGETLEVNTSNDIEDHEKVPMAHNAEETGIKESGKCIEEEVRDTEEASADEAPPIIPTLSNVKVETIEEIFQEQNLKKEESAVTINNRNQPEYEPEATIVEKNDQSETVENFSAQNNHVEHQPKASATEIINAENINEEKQVPSESTELSYDVDGVEKIPELDSANSPELRDGHKIPADEATEIKEVTNVQIQQLENVAEEVAQSNLHPTATVDRVEDNIQEVYLQEKIPEDEAPSKLPVSEIVKDEKGQEILKQHTMQEEEDAAIAIAKICRQENDPEMTAIIDEAIDQPETTANISAQNEHVEHQSKASATDIVIAENINEERKVTSERSTKSSQDVDEVEKIAELPPVNNSEILDGSKIPEDEATDIKEATNVEIQQSKIENAAEDIALSNLHTTAAVGRVEDNIKEVYSEEEILEDEAKSKLLISEIVKEEKAREIIQEELKNEAESVVIDTKEEKKPISPSIEIEELEKVPFSHTRNNLEIKDDEEVKQEKPREGEEATETQPLRTAIESTPDDKSIPCLPTISPVRVETVEESIQEELKNEVELVVIDTKEEQKPISPSTEVEELENVPVPNTIDKLDIKDDDEVKQEEASKGEVATEIQPRESATESALDDKAISCLFTKPPVRLELDEATIEEELKNEAGLVVIDTKEEITEVEELENILVSDTTDKLYIKDDEVVKQEEASKGDVATEIQPLKTATESTLEDKAISSLSTIEPVKVESVEETIEELKNEAELVTIDAKEEQKPISPSTEVEEIQNVPVSHITDNLDIKDDEELKQEEASAAEVEPEIHPLKTATETAVEDKSISSLSTIPPVRVESIEQTIERDLKNEAESVVIDTKEEQKPIIPSTEVEELEEVPISHTIDELEIKDDEEVKQDEATEMQPLKPEEESALEGKPISGLSTIPPVRIEEVKETIEEKLKYEAELVVIDTRDEQEPTCPRTEVEYLEKVPVSDTIDKLVIKDDEEAQQAESTEGEPTTEIQPLKTSVESTPEDNDISCLPTIPLFSVETVQESIQEELKNEAESVMTDTKEDKKPISPSNEVEELENPPVSLTTRKLDIKDGEEPKQEEASEAEVESEIQLLKAAAETSLEDKYTSSLSTIPPGSVELVENVIEQDLKNEDESLVIATKEQQKPISPSTEVKELENVPVSHTIDEVEIKDDEENKQEEEKDGKEATEIQRLQTAEESIPLSTVETNEESIQEKLKEEAESVVTDNKEEQKPKSPSTEVEYFGKVPASHTIDELEIKDDEEVKQEEAKDGQEATEMQPLKTAKESALEDTAISSESTTPPITVELDEATIEEELKTKSELVTIDTKEKQNPTSPSTEIEELEKLHVLDTIDNLDIKQYEEAKQEESSEGKPTTEIQPLKTSVEISPEDNSISGLSTTPQDRVETVEESIQEELKNEAESVITDTKEEQNPISENTRVEKLENLPVSDTTGILDIEHGEELKQEEASEAEVEPEIQPSKTATETAVEDKSISSLSTIPPVRVESVEETIEQYLENEAQFLVIDTKEELEPIGQSTEVETLEKLPVSHTTGKLDIADGEELKQEVEKLENLTVSHTTCKLDIENGEELKQEKASEAEVEPEFQPLKTATETVVEDKSISGLSTIQPVRVESVEEVIEQDLKNEAASEVIDTKEELEPISPSVVVEEHGKVPTSHAIDELEIKDDGEVKQDEAKNGQEATEMQPLKTTEKSALEDKAISSESTIPPVTVQLVEETEEEHKNEAELVMIDTKEEQKQKTLSTEIEELEKVPVLNTTDNLDIKEYEEAKQEEPSEGEPTTEIQPLRTSVESAPEKVEESIQEEQKNEAEFVMIDTKEEQKPIRESTEVETLEKLPVSHTTGKLDIKDGEEQKQEVQSTEVEKIENLPISHITHKLDIENGEELKQEEASEAEVEPEFQPLKTETETVVEDKSISSLSTIQPVSVESAEEVIQHDFKMKAESVVIDTKEELEPISPSIVVEEHGKVPTSYTLDEVEIKDDEEVEQDEAKYGQEATEMQPLKTTEKSALEDKATSSESTTPPVTVQLVEETVQELQNEAELVTVDTKEEQKPTTPSTEIEELEKVPALNTTDNLEIKEYVEAKQEESREEEPTTEIQPLRTSFESAPDPETVEERIQEERKNEAEFVMIDTKEVQKPISESTEVETLEKLPVSDTTGKLDIKHGEELKQGIESTEVENLPVSHITRKLDIEDGEELKQEEASEAEVEPEFQPLKTATETVVEDKYISSFSTIQPVRVETVEEVIEQDLKNEAESVVIDTKEELEPISPSIEVEEHGKVPASHTIDEVEIKDDEEVKKDEAKDRQEATEMQPLTITEKGAMEDKAISSESTLPPVTVETVEETIEEELQNESKLVEIDTTEEQKPTSPSTEVEELEKLRVSDTIYNLIIKQIDEAKQEESSEGEQTAEIQPPKTSVESAPDDNAITCSSTTPLVRVETVGESIQEELKYEAESVMIDTREEQKPITESTEVERLVNIPVPHTNGKLDIEDGEELKQEVESTEVEKLENLPASHPTSKLDIENGEDLKQEEASEGEVEPETQPLKTATETVVEDKSISGLSTIQPVRVESVEEVIEQDSKNEAASVVLDTKEELEPISLSIEVEEHGKVTASHTIDEVDIKDDEEVKQQEAKDGQEATEMQQLNTTENGAMEDKAISSESTLPPVTVELVEETIEEELKNEAELVTTDTTEEQKPTTPSSKNEELEKLPVSDTIDNLDIKQYQEVKQEESTEGEQRIEIHPLKTSVESSPDDNTISCSSTTPQVRVEESIQEELKNEEESVITDSKEEQKPIAESTEFERLEHFPVPHTTVKLDIEDGEELKQEVGSTEVEKLENLPISHTTSILEIEDGEELNQEKASETEVEPEFQPLKTATETVVEDKSISGLSTLQPVKVESVEEVIEQDLKNEAESVVIDTKEELEPISLSIEVEEHGKVPASHTIDEVETKDDEEVKQQEAKDGQEATEMQQLETTENGAMEDKAISSESTLPPVTVELVEETIEEEHQKPTSPSTEVEELEKLPVSDTIYNLIIKQYDAAKQEESSEGEQTTEIQPPKTSIESAPEDNSVSCSSTTPLVTVETVGESIQEELKNEAESVMIDTKEEQKPITESTEVERLEKLPIPHTNGKLDIKDGEELKQEVESTEVEKHENLSVSHPTSKLGIENGEELKQEEASEAEVEPEIQPLKTATETVVEDKSISSLSTIPPFRVESVEEVMEKDLKNEVEPVVINTKEEPEPISPSIVVAELGKVPVSHTIDELEINYDGEVKQEEAKDGQEATEMQPLKTAEESDLEDKAISSVSTVLPVTVELVEETIEELRNEAELVVTDTNEEQKLTSPSTEVEELQKFPVSDTLDNLDINDDEEAEEEGSGEAEPATQIQPLKTSVESIKEELKNEALSVMIDTKEEKNAISPSTEVEELENIPISHTTSKLDIQDGEELKQEEASEAEVESEIQPLKTATETAIEDKSISSLSTTPPIRVESVEETIEQDLKNRAESVVIDTKEEQKQIRTSTEVEELEKVRVSDTRDKLDIKDDEEIKQEEAGEEEEPTEIHPLKTATESVPRDISTIAFIKDMAFEKSVQEEIFKEVESSITNTEEGKRPENGFEENTKDIEAFDQEAGYASTEDEKKADVQYQAQSQENMVIKDLNLEGQETEEISPINDTIENSQTGVAIERITTEPETEVFSHEQETIDDSLAEKIPGSPYPCKNLEPYFDSEAHNQTKEQLPKTKEKSDNAVDPISEFDDHIQGQKLEHENQINPEPQIEGITPLNIEPISAASLITEGHDKVDKADVSENIEEQPTDTGEGLPEIQVKDHDNNNSKATDSIEKIKTTNLEIDSTRKEASSQGSGEATEQENLETQEAEINQVGSENEEEEKQQNEFEKISPSDDIVLVEGSRDIEVKGSHKKSHGILSGVGSKVKHSISKVKKAITGSKSSQPKPHSPKSIQQ